MLDLSRPENASLGQLVIKVAGMSRSDIGRLREAKLLEIGRLEHAIAERRGRPYLDQFPVTRDRNRIRELELEIVYLTELFGDPQPDHPPPEAA